MITGEIKPLSASETLSALPPVFTDGIDAMLTERLSRLGRKVIALDDDPTGIQTVHDISVYTNWDLESIQNGFAEDENLFFCLTNSRSFTSSRTAEAHREMASNISAASKASGKNFLLISRSDSTMRGHYPLETETLRETIESQTSIRYDGEVIIPFFLEGGRFTLENIHYVQEGGSLVPCGQTEFAKDKTFGYRSSHLGEWCEEKTNGLYKASSMTYIPLRALRGGDVRSVTGQLMEVTGFNKIIVNAAAYEDVKVFAVALLDAILNGKEFLIRGAAAITRVLGNISARPLLTGEELVGGKKGSCGVVLAGSHVRRTTEQLEALRELGDSVVFLEFDQHMVKEKGGLEKEAARCVSQTREILERNKTVVIATRRERFDLDADHPEAQLRCAGEIADALTSIVAKLEKRPDFLITKGGITSSDVGTKALKVRRARVMGQIKPGIPVWKTGEESKFPGLPLVIFPGNVGSPSTLKECVELLMNLK